jgi:hypothetical protein
MKHNKDLKAMNSIKRSFLPLITSKHVFSTHDLYRFLLYGLLSSLCLLQACDDTGKSTNPMQDEDMQGSTGGSTATSDMAMAGNDNDGCPQKYRCNAATNNRERCTQGIWSDDPCDDGLRCQAEGECIMESSCTPGTTRCVNSYTLANCNDEGQWEDFACQGSCQDNETSAACQEAECIPGARICQNRDTVIECNAAGSDYRIVERCRGDQTGQECSRGECTPLCVLNEKVKTNIGCDYWAADLDNAFVQGYQGFLDAANAPFAVVVSNPSESYTGEVSVYDHDGIIDQAILPPLGLHIFSLPRKDIDGTILDFLAYRVRSSIPIIAYQFNPLENEEVFSNDASLLLPSHVLGKEYLVMTREQSFDRLRGYVTIVGISEEATQVTVTVSAPTQEGPIGMIPALEPGESYTTTLSAFEVLSLQTRAPGADLTGTRVVANSPVVVFGGSEAANVPNTNHCVNINPMSGEGVCEADTDVVCSSNYDCNEAGLNTCCADHLEQQMFPINTWGRHYIATKSFDRNLEKDYWRILASEDNTKVETIPPFIEIPNLNAGEWFEFGSREHFEIISDKPVMVGQFLAGEHAPNPNVRGGYEVGDARIGDPAFLLSVPNAQFRQDFVFLAPNKYALDYVSIIAPLDTEVYFDDRPVENWEPVGESLMWQVSRFPIADGVHLLVADKPVGVLVYGYDSYVSYGYPAGLNLNVVDPETGDAIDMQAGNNNPQAGTEAGNEADTEAGNESQAGSMAGNSP